MSVKNLHYINEAVNQSINQSIDRSIYQLIPVMEFLI